MRKSTPLSGRAPPSRDHLGQIRFANPTPRNRRGRRYNDAVASELNDTDPETQHVHRELLRRAGPSRRLGLAFSLSRTVMSLSRAGLAERLATNDPQEIGLGFVALHYGEDLARAVRSSLAARRQ
jgi:hypothetical protein